MKLLITGASGFVGTFLQKTLAGQYDWLKLSREKTEELLSSQSPPQAYSQIDTLIHLAGRAHVMQETAEDVYRAYASVNIDYTLRVAELAKRLNIKRFVFLSSIKVNGEISNQPFTEKDSPAPLDAYGQTKLEAEIALKEFCNIYRIELVIIRPPLIYGSGVKANFRQLIKLCQLPLPLPFASVKNKRSFVSLDNLADFILLCSWHPKAANQTFLISDGDDVSTAELIKTIRQASNHKPLLIALPPLILEWIFKLSGQSSLATRLLSTLQVDNSKAKTLLDWQPKIKFRDGILRALKE